MSKLLRRNIAIIFTMLCMLVTMVSMTICVSAQDVEIVSVTWSGTDTTYYWGDTFSSITAYGKDANNVEYPLNVTYPEGFGTEATTYTLTATLSSGFKFASNCTNKTATVKVNKKLYAVSMEDAAYTASFDATGKSVSSYSIQVVCEDILPKASYTVDSFNTIGEHTVTATFTPTNNYAFVDKNGKEITTLTAKLTLSTKAGYATVTGDDKADVYVEASSGSFYTASAKELDLSADKALDGYKTYMGYELNVQPGTYNITITLPAKTLRTFTRDKHSDSLSKDCIYTYANDTLTKIENVEYAGGTYKLSNVTFTEGTTISIVIAPEYHAPFFATIYGILVIVAIILIILILMYLSGKKITEIENAQSNEGKEQPTEEVVEEAKEEPAEENANVEEPVEEIQVEEPIPEVVTPEEDKPQENEVESAIAALVAETPDVEEPETDYAEIFTNFVRGSMKACMALDNDQIAKLYEDKTTEETEKDNEEADVAASIPAIVEDLFDKVPSATGIDGITKDIIVAAVTGASVVLPAEFGTELIDASKETVIDELAARLIQEEVQEVIEETPIEEVVTEETPVEEAPIEEVVTEETPVEEAPVETPIAAPIDVVTDTEEEEEEDSADTLSFKDGYKPSYFNVKLEPDRYATALEEEKEGKCKVLHKYPKSFASRLNQSTVQDYYNEIKNFILSYKQVTSRLSTDNETFKHGRVHIAKLNANRGTLDVFIALDPKNYVDSKYNVIDMSARKKYDSVPLLMKVKGDRKFKHTLELLTILLEEKLGLVKNPKYEVQNYVTEPKTLDQLLEEDLIKHLAASVPVEYIAENAYESTTLKEEQTSTAIEEIPADATYDDVPQEIEDEEEEDEDNDDDECKYDAKAVAESQDVLMPISDPFGKKLAYIDIDQEPEKYQEMLRDEEAGKIVIVHRIRKTYMSRMAKSTGNVQDYYNEIKNFLLSYKGVKNRVSAGNETFKFRRDHIVKLNPNNGTLCVYIALDPKDFVDTKFGGIDMSEKKKYEAVPMLMRVRGNRKFAFTMELLEKLMNEKLMLKKIKDYTPVDYRVLKNSDEDLVAAGYIKRLAAPMEKIDE